VDSRPPGWRKSITWGRQSYRWSDLDFRSEFEGRNRRGLADRYADIEHVDDYVKSYGISGQAEGLPQLPDGNFSAMK